MNMIPIFMLVGVHKGYECFNIAFNASIATRTLLFVDVNASKNLKEVKSAVECIR